MRILAKILALSVVAGFAASAYAAPMGGGGMGGGGMGGGRMGGGAGGGVILPEGGAGGGMRSGGGFSGQAPTGGSARGGFAGSTQSAPRTSSAQPGQMGSRFNGSVAGNGDDWRRHHHHRGFFPGPVFGFGYDYTPDVNQCWVLRRVYNARGAFIGWRHVDVCSG